MCSLGWGLSCLNSHRIVHWALKNRDLPLSHITTSVSLAGQSCFVAWWPSKVQIPSILSSVLQSLIIACVVESSSPPHPGFILQGREKQSMEETCERSSAQGLKAQHTHSSDISYWWACCQMAGIVGSIARWVSWCQLNSAAVGKGTHFDGQAHILNCSPECLGCLRGFVGSEGKTSKICVCF